MKKFSKRELNVLSMEISKRVGEERKKRVEEKLKKNKEYLSLVKEGEKIIKLGEELEEKKREVYRRLSDLNNKLGYGIGSMEGSIVLSEFGKKGIGFKERWVGNVDIENKLILKGIEGEVNVKELIEELVKELV